jgi:SAM-dependent methyltransferase
MERKANDRTGERPASNQPKLYGELASWFHLLTAPEDYADEADLYKRIIMEASGGSARTLLELGSGGGNNASHLKAHFRLTLVDRSQEMLELSRSLNPECEHIVGDMRTIRLDRVFDVVFVHDAVSYITTESDLRAVAKTAFAHCGSGGIALFVPDYVRERFMMGTEHGGHDGDGRALRYLAWAWDPDPTDVSYVVDFAYLLRDALGSVRVERDRHVCGAFARSTWLRVLAEAGFRPDVREAEHEEDEGRELFLGLRAN